MFDLEKAIVNWLRSFRKQQAYDEGAIREMELHLRDHIDDVMADGFSEADAFQQAVTSFGDIQPVAEEEYANIKVKTSIKSILFKAMLSNYFKTTLRSMMKNPLSSFINIFGLAVAIGACMVTYAFINYDYSIDRFHENRDNLFLTTFSVNRGGALVQYGTTPAPLAEMLQADFPSIEKVCRIESGSAIIRYEDKVFSEHIKYVDPAYLEVFTFPLKWGLSSSLRDKNSIILSQEMSSKYFGSENPIGETIKVLFGLERFKIFEITGVAQTFPEARIIDFDFLVNIENIQYGKPDYNFNDWKKEVDATFILLRNASDLSGIKSAMTKYKQAQNGVDPDWPIESFDFVSLNDLHLSSGQIRNDISYDGTEEGRISLPIISGFLLVLACFNYINISMVSGTKRLKEIGLRKVIGANRRVIILQFFSENVLLTALAALIGFIIAATAFLPWFASIAPVTSQFDLLDPTMWSFLIVVLLLTAIFSGLYPAFYISKFQAVQIFRGSLKFGKKNILTKVFLTLQLALTCVGIAFAVILAENSSYQMDRSWGYNQKQVLYEYTGDYSAFVQLEKRLLEHPEVLAVVGSKHHFAKSRGSATIHLPNRQLEVKELAVGEGYLQTMGISLREGRWLQQDGMTDLDKVVINEQLAKRLDFIDPISQNIKIENQTFEIVGVVEDAHFYNFYYEINPTIFIVAEKEDYRYLSIKTQEGSQHEVYEALRSYNSELFPSMPFLGGFQEDIWNGFYDELRIQSGFSKVIALLFILLSSLGLYGLIQLNLAGRIKEFSIRKTLGASKHHIAFKIFHQYIFIFIISVLIGAPLGYLMNDLLLDMMYPGPRPSGVGGSVLAASLLVIILVSVVLTQVNRVVKSNPVDGLKAE